MRPPSAPPLASPVVASLPQRFMDIPVLKLLSRPRGFPKKRQTGFDRRIEHETAHRNALRQSGPTVTLHHRLQDALQGHAVQRIVRMGLHA